MAENETAVPVDEQELTKQLTAAPGIDSGCDGRLVRLPPSDLRTDSTVRAKYEWRDAAGIRYNLVAGQGAGDELERTEGFYRTYPDLSVRPALRLDVGGYEVAVFEHFDGRSFEALLASGELSLNGARELLDNLIDRLEAPSIPADEAAIRCALDALCAQVRACPVWGLLDLQFLDQVVFPLLETTCPRDRLRLRWTNGDFVARNILVNERGEYRLIDGEFASQTPFADADYFRFGEFSDVPEALREHVLQRLPGEPRWWRIHFCLDQVCKLTQVRPAAALPFDVAALFERLLRETWELADLSRATCLHLPRQTFHALERHARGLQEQYEELQRHASELQSQYEALHEHSNGLQAHYGALQSHCESLTAHATNLQIQCDVQALELVQIRSEKADLTRRLHRIKRPWLWLNKQ